MLRFGNISETNVVDGLYKVGFEEDNLVSSWLPYLVKNTKENKYENPFDIGEHVACLMDENCENGVILGATNTSADKPVVGDKDVSRVTYKDGSFVQFNRATKKLTISCEGDVEIIKSKNVNVKSDTKIVLESANIEIKGKLKVTDDATFTKDITSTTGDIKATVGDVKAFTHSLSTHTHNVTAVGSPTGPAIP